MSFPVIREENISKNNNIEYLFLKEDSSTKQNTFLNYLYIIKKRRWSIIIPLLIMMPVVILNSMVKKESYEATSTILIEDVVPKIIAITEVSEPEKTPIFHTTQYEIIKSRPILEEVTDILHLDKRLPEKKTPLEEFVKSINSLPGRIIGAIAETIMRFQKDDAQSVEEQVYKTPHENANLHRQRVVADLQSDLKVEPRLGTKLVDISLQGRNPEDVARQVNTIAEVYVRQNLENKLDASLKATSWLQKEAETLKEKIRKSEESLQNFKEKRQVVAHEKSNIGETDIQRMSALNLSYMEKNNQRINMQADINELKRLLNGNVDDITKYPELLTNNTINSLRSKYVDLKIQYNDISSKYKEKHPKIISLSLEIENIKNAINEEIKRTIDGMENKYKAIVAQENELKRTLGSQENKVIRSSKDGADYEMLKRDLEVQKSMYLEVSKRLAETTLTAALATNNVKIVEKALEGVPVAPGRITSIFFGLIVGLGFGGVLAFLAEYFDKRFQTVEDAEQYMGLPFLGFIPHYKLAKHRAPQLITLQEPWTMASEAYRTLRTWIQLLQRPVRTVLITSAVAGEGKSTTAANLAVSFAQLGRRVLLVDTDLRRPTLHSLFNIEDNREGLTEVLVLGSDWKVAMRDSPMENLKILLVGRRPVNPTELLSTMRMQQLIETWRECFDVIIFDSPVILTIPDTAILAPKMDGVILVHNQYRSNREIAFGAKKLLERVGANILGMVFNNIDAKEGRYYSGSSYSLNRYEEKNAENKFCGNFIDMRPSETDKEWKISSDMPPHSSDVHTLSIIENTARSTDCFMTIHAAFLQKGIAEYEARNGFSFLIIDIEICNVSSLPQLFDPIKTSVIIPDDQESVYGNALKSVVPIKGVNGEDDSQFSTMQHFPCDQVLTQAVSGLSKQIEIKENGTIKGMIVYQVSDIGGSYLFKYNDHDIKILISLIRS